MIPQDFLKAVAIEHFVSDNELEVLSMALRGEPILGIANKLDLSPEAVRKRLGEVYKKFRISGAGPGKLAKLMSLLDSLHQKSLNPSSTEVFAASPQIEVVSEERRFDWGEAPNVSVIYGRARELETLERWMVEENCQMVALLGMVGIGKTALAVNLVEQIKDKFDYFIWRSLRRQPAVEDLLDELIYCLPKQRKTPAPNNLNDQISRLLECLNESRCLVVLDNLETLLQPKDLAGNYAKQHQSYGELLWRLGEERHQSCIVIISREKPKEISLLEGEDLKVCSLRLKGLELKYAAEILKANKLADEDDFEGLIEIYRGNPLALKIVTNKIKDIFGGSVAEFLAQDITLSQDIRKLIDKEFERLSKEEIEIVRWMAILDTPVVLADLKTYLPELESKLFEALESLWQRSLLERNTEGFTLPTVVLDYLQEQLIEEVYHSILNPKLDKLEPIDKYDWSLNESLIEKLIERLRNMVRNENRLQEQLNQIQAKLPKKSLVEVGYGEENIQFLMEQLQLS